MLSIQDVLVSQTVDPLAFNCLDTLIRGAGLEYLLQGDHPLTLFAPIDRAFEAYGSGGVYDFLKDIDKLTTLLQYHMVPLLLTTDDLRRLTEEVGMADEHGVVELPTYSHQTLRVRIDDLFLVNDCKVYRTDLLARNGVVHVLNDVLWPPSLSYDDFGTRSPANTTSP